MVLSRTACGGESDSSESWVGWQMVVSRTADVVESDSRWF